MQLVYTAYCGVALKMNSYNPDLMLGLVPETEYVAIFNVRAAKLYVALLITKIHLVLAGVYCTLHRHNGVRQDRPGTLLLTCKCNKLWLEFATDRIQIMVAKWQRYVIYGTVGFSTLYSTGHLFFSLFQCGSPTDFLKNQILGKCVSNDALLAVNMVAGVINALADWILAVLPVFLLRKAQMPLPAKIIAGCLMTLGAAGSISSIIRLTFLHSFKPGPNFFWTSIQLTMWSIIECGVCIIAGSLATLRPMFHCCLENARAFTPTLGGSSFGGSHAKGSNSTGTETSRSHSHRKRDSFVPLSDMITWQDPHLDDNKNTPRLQIRHQGTGSFVVGQANGPDRLGAPTETPARQEAARKAKALELSRIATQATPDTVLLQGSRAPHHCESPVDPQHPTVSRFQQSRFEWV